MKKFYRLMNEFSGDEGSSNVADIKVDPNETFDDMDYVSDSSKKIGESFNEKFKDKIERVKGKQEAKEEVKAKKGDDLDVLDMEQKDLEEEEDDKEDKPKEKKAEKKEKLSKEDDKEGEKEETAEQKAETADSKKLKIRQADGLYAIDADAKVRVKIDGAFQEVPVQELVNNYSGKVAYDKKFSEIGEKNKQADQLIQQHTKQAEVLKNVVAEVTSHLSDKMKNPIDALNFIVEKSGMDPYDVWKRMLEANLDEVEKLMSFSDLERENYLLKKQAEFRTKSEEARKAEFTKEQSFNQAVQKVDSLRQAHGVSEEQFVQALDELEASGADMSKVSDEFVVDHASLKPHVESVQDVLEPFESSIDDSKYSKIVRDLARQLRAKDFSKEQLMEWAKKEFMDEDLKDLQSRTKEVPKNRSKVEVKAPTKIETLDFDDED